MEARFRSNTNMRRTSLKLLTLSLLLAAGAAGAQTFTGADLGTPTLKGSVVTNSDGTITITGGGADLWGTADAGYYFYTSVTGQDWDAVVHVLNLTGPDNWTKCELMVRQDDASGSPFPQADDSFIGHVTTRMAGQDELETQYRPVAAGSSYSIATPWIWPNYPNVWLRIQRRGSVFTLQQGPDGTHWDTFTQIDTATTLTSHFDGNAWSDPLYVGVAVTAHKDSDKTGGKATISDLSVKTIPAPTTIGVAQNVQSTTAYENTETGFSFRATNDVSLPFLYQWYKNGQPITNAVDMRGDFTFLAGAADNGAQFYCKATVVGYPNQALTSSTGTLSVLPGSLTVNGGLKVETFLGATRQQVEAGDVGPADSIGVVSSFEMPPNDGINYYARRVSGLFIAPATGDYVFFVNSDDDSDLFLSTDANPANKQLIAQETGYSGSRLWITGGNTTQKRSDQFSPDGGVTYPYQTGIHLVQGSKYYIEGVQHQGTGGDNFAATYKLMTNADPADGDAPLLAATNNNIAYLTSPSTNLTITTQPQDLTVLEGDTASFTVAAATDGELTPTYQWYENDTLIAGATAATYNFVADYKDDNGAKFYAIAQTPSMSATSSVATLTVQPEVFESGRVKVEFWSQRKKAEVEAGTAGPPDYVTSSPGFEAGVNAESGDHYARRISGYFIPPADGDYVFFVNSDDTSDLFLSTDESPAHKRLIAQELTYASAYNWVNDHTASDIPKKRSDQWTDANGNTPYANGIHLLGGQRYYLEADHEEGTGGDHVEVTAVTVAEAAVITNGEDTTLQGNVIGFKLPGPTHASFTQQPQDVSTLSGNSATFSATATTDSSVSIGGIGLPVTNIFVLYQWSKNGTAISGATDSSYTTPLLLPSDTGEQFSCAIRALGMPDWSNSQPATLTVIADTNAPTLVYVAAYTNANLLLMGNASDVVVDLTFSKRMDLASLEQLANYTVSGATVTAVTVNTNAEDRMVELQLSGPPTAPVTVSVNGLKDFSGNALASGASIPVPVLPLTLQDIGSPGYDPLLPSQAYATGTNAFSITAGGHDIWGTGDACAFLFEMKTNDFDVAIRQTYITHSDTWAKAGLMAREAIDDPGSKMWAVNNTPLASDGIPAADGSGAGASQVQYISRPSVDGSAAHAYTINPAPVYPNAWLRLKRVGQVFSAYMSTNGADWTEVGSQDATQVGDSNAVSSVMYVGVDVTAHISATTYSDPATYPLYENTSLFDHYMSAYVQPPPAPTLTAAISGSNILISWSPSGGQLQSSPVLGAQANWQPVGTSNPATVPISGQMQFFRVVGP